MGLDLAQLLKNVSQGYACGDDNDLVSVCVCVCVCMYVCVWVCDMLC